HCIRLFSPQHSTALKHGHGNIKTCIVATGGALFPLLKHYAKDSTILMLLRLSSSLMEISRAFSSLDTTCSMDGRCCLWPVHDRASFRQRSNASTEYSPLSLGSANSNTFPSLMSKEA
uniref:Uncharacterized protein n=1 Tax=Aegilops tauschii subsp. strangulata TaxID=200361 RepID=A0A453C5W8_AEGTS